MLYILQSVAAQKTLCDIIVCLNLDTLSMSKWISFLSKQPFPSSLHFTCILFDEKTHRIQYSLMNIIINSSVFQDTSVSILYYKIIWTPSAFPISKKKINTDPPRSSGTIKLAIFTNPKKIKAASEAPLTKIARNICLLYTSWWLNQPIWKICSSKWVHLPQGSGWK